VQRSRHNSAVAQVRPRSAGRQSSWPDPGLTPKSAPGPTLTRVFLDSSTVLDQDGFSLVGA
jgi:hypothetical protein